MKIRMIKRAPGAPDGYTVKDYRAGETYDLSGERPERMGQAFVDNGDAEFVERVAIETEDTAAEDKKRRQAEGSDGPEGRGIHWTLTTPAERYLERYPDSKQSDLARWVLDVRDEHGEPLVAEKPEVDDTDGE